MESLQTGQALSCPTALNEKALRQSAIGLAAAYGYRHGAAGPGVRLEGVYNPELILLLGR